MDFSSDDSFSLSEGGDGEMDDLDAQLFGGLSKKASSEQKSEISKKKSVSFDDFGSAKAVTSSTAGILKTESKSDAPKMKESPVKASLDDFLNEFDDDDGLDDLLASESSVAPENDPIRKPNPAKTLLESKSETPITKTPDEKLVTKPVKSLPENNELDFEFSEEDSLLELGPKKMKPVENKEKDVGKPKQSESDLSNTKLFGTGQSMFSDDESDLTMTQSEKTPVEKSQKRAVSPPKNDDSFLQNLLGTKKPENPDKPKTAKNPPVFNFDDDSKSAKNDELLVSDEDDTLNIISKKPVRMAKAVAKPESVTKPVLESVPEKTIINPTSHQPVIQPSDNVNQQILNLTNQLQAQNISNFQSSQNDQIRVKMNELESKMIDESRRFTNQIKELEIGNQSHINRLKKSHQESVQLLKDEKDAQIQRIKIMHEDELSAFKTASSTTQDVKELLISVQSATNSLKEIAQRVEDSNSRASNHAELFSEMTKLKTAIQMERKNFEMEREKMIQMVNEMAKFTREQKEVSNNERLRLDSELQRIETERRLLEEEKLKLHSELQLKSQENLHYKNTLLEEQRKQMALIAEEKHKIATEWAKIQEAKHAIFDVVTPDAFVKYEENVRQAAKAVAESGAVRRELEMMERRLSERRGELDQEKKLLRLERDEIQRTKNSIRREEESIKARYADFISDTAEGRTALEAAKRIELRANEKMKEAETAAQNLRNERELLRQERTAVRQLQTLEQKPEISLDLNATCDSINESFQQLMFDDPLKTLNLDPDLFTPLQFH